MSRRQLIHVDGDAVASVLDMRAAIDAIDAAMKEDQLPATPLRSRIALGDGELLLMPSAGPAAGGVKLVTVGAAGTSSGVRPTVQGVYVLFSSTTLEPVLSIDASALTAVRTAAVSGWMTDQLARADATSLTIFGSGTQAVAHFAAMRAVRNIESLTVVGTNPTSVASLVATATEAGVRSRAGASHSIAGSDLVCCCTSSPTPVVSGHLLQEGVHVNAIGAHSPTTRELDGTAIARAKVVVESREAALAEAGDLRIAMAEGCFEPNQIVAEMHDLARGVQVRTSRDDITVFKSVGVAFEDLILATHIAASLGTEI